VSSGAIRGYTLLWVLGLGFVWWPVLAVRAWGARRLGARPDVWPALVAALLLLSLLVAAVTGAPFGRVVGAAYNLSVWVALVAVTMVRLDVDAVSRGIAQLAGLQSAAVLGALALYPALSGAVLPAAHLLPVAVREEPAFESFLTVRLVMEDYFGTSVLRTAGFFGNATWAGALAALGLLVSVRLLRNGSLRLRLLYGLLAVADGVTLYLSYSRNTWLALALALLAGGVLALRLARRWHTLTVLGVLGVGSVTYAVTSVDLGQVFAEFNSVREGSLGSRTAIYTATWQAVQDAWFPLLGNGFKERLPGLVASLGTHSGYLGTLYRGGWLALVCLVIWLGVLAVRSWRAASPVALAATVFAAVWFIAEDIDAGHLAPLAVVVALAAIGCSPTSAAAPAQVAAECGGFPVDGSASRPDRLPSRRPASLTMVQTPRA
jgi:O-antigen ligase